MIGQAMRVLRRQSLPLAPLLRAYRAALPSLEDLGRLPGLGRRFQAIRAARHTVLSDTFVNQAGEREFQEGLAGFYAACVQPPLHAETLHRRSGIVRHALSHLLHGAGPLPDKLEHCLTAAGPYHVAGLGPAFWSAIVQGLEPLRHAAWTPAVVAGLKRLGFADGPTTGGAGSIYSALLEAYARIRALEPTLTALHVDHFLTLVAAMRSRDLWSGQGALEWPGLAVDLPTLIQQVRVGLSLRRRVKERGRELRDAGRQLEKGLAAQNVLQIGSSLVLADPAGAARSRLRWRAHAEAVLCWTGRLWEAGDPYETLEAFWRTDPIPGAGLWLPGAVLHLKDAQHFQPWNETTRQGFALLDDGATDGESTAECYRLFNNGIAVLCRQYKLHPLEAPAVLAALEPTTAASPKPGTFGGFCADTFGFLAELAENNRRDWMEEQRDRYRFAVREPLVELCQALAERYVEPVVHGEHGWDLETSTRSGRALTSICKNDYGRSVPYHTALWITFYRRTARKHPAPETGWLRRTEDVQFFVRLDAEGLLYGLRLGDAAREASDLFHKSVAEHGESLFQALQHSGVLVDCRFGEAADLHTAHAVTNPGELRAWAAGKSPMAARLVPADSPLVGKDELVGDILLTFDRLLPAYACAAVADPTPWLRPPGDNGSWASSYSPTAFCKATYLDQEWLQKTQSLLDLKRQLILQGVPGTGKTHVARCLARLLTGGRDEAVQLVQFHPAYSYEEFVEGIKVRSIEVNGRHEVTYPVEDGLLCAFAAEAARQPAQPHVLIVDEINRGNLPRIFGELLYLLEYREQSIRLPYSKREFRLPANLFVLGTMNAADRSVALVDQALRRRFSFLDMHPDAAVLAAWLNIHPPAEGAAFAPTVTTVFGRLNAQLTADLGPQYQVGHSYFMVPDLDTARLRVIWEHHVRPLLEEYFAGHPARLGAYELDKLLQGERHKPGGRKRQAAQL
jgi:hypothetical protein